MDPNDRMNAESKLQNGARNRGDGGWGRTFTRFRCRHRSSRCHPMPVSMGHSGLADFILAAKSDPDVESKPARHMALTRCLSRSGCAQRERTRRLKMKVDMPGKKRRKQTGKVDLRVCATDCVRGGQNSNAGTVRPGPHQCQNLSGAHTRQQYEKKKTKLGQTLMWRLEKTRRFPRHYWQGAIMAAWAGQRSPSKTCIVGATDVAFQGQAFVQPANRENGDFSRLPPARLSADRRLIAGVKLIRVPSSPRRHRNWHSPRPHPFPTSPFSAFNNIALITTTILQRRFQLWILSSSDPQCSTCSHDMEVKEGCNR